jgi:murein DD-endopeptidase MepM/ murein hydrolase activator NlpD
MKRRRHEQRGAIIPALFVCLVTGALFGWWFRGVTPSELIASPSDPTMSPPRPVLPEVLPALRSKVAEPESAPPTGASSIEPTIGIDPIMELRHRHLRLPVDVAQVDSMKGDFTERRGGGTRGHEATDLMAPRSTPVRAVESGSIAKLFFSKAGGITIYQFDPSGQFCYYYAHLDRYAEGLKEGQQVNAGDVIGYVGSTGNAAENAPHLHFAIYRLTDERRWWQGTPLDPYLVFKP